MQARDMLLLNGGDDTGGLKCPGRDVGVERFDEPTDYDESVGNGTGRNGLDCAWHRSGAEYYRLCLTVGVSGERA